MSVRSSDMTKRHGFHITRDKTSLLMRNPCSFKGDRIMRYLLFSTLKEEKVRCSPSGPDMPFRGCCPRHCYRI